MLSPWPPELSVYADAYKLLPPGKSQALFVHEIYKTVSYLLKRYYVGNQSHFTPINYLISRFSAPRSEPILMYPRNVYLPT